MFNIKSTLLFFIVCIILMAVIVLGCGKDDKPDKKENKKVDGVKITMLDVDHGDAILLQEGKQNILIDAGHKDMRQVLLKKLDDLDVKKINTVIITHHDADHLGNVFEVAKKFKVENIYDNGVYRDDHQTSVKLHAALNRGEYNARRLKAGDTIKLNDNYWFEVLSPGSFIRPNFPKQSNNNSVVMKLHYKNFTMLFTGDIEKPAEEVLVAKYGDKLKADILKVAHHGINTSSSKEFVSKVAPKYAVISCGQHDKIGQPNIGVVSRLRKLGAIVYNTENNGDIIIQVGDKDYSVKSAR